jgi:5S rRNA maturation endonuclease (ribonuclease M5)
MNPELSDLNDWVEELKHCGKIIVVEGKKDILALKKLGVDEKNIIPLNKPLFEIVEDIVNKNNNKNFEKNKKIKNNINKNKKNNKEIIILTDLDKKGKQLYGKLKKDLCKNGCKIDHYFREFLQRKTKIRQIEGLPRYIERLK